MDDDTELREKLFHSIVREYVIFLLLFILLYVTSYALISAFRKRKEEFYDGDEEDAMVYRISLWMCTFALAVSFGAALLLPMSIVSNEVLLLYPNSYYVQWLNSSLIQGLWNVIFLFSNVALFVLLPFAYFFTESEGFSGSRKGIMARVYETFVVLALLALLVLGMTYILSALLDYGRFSMESLFTTHEWDGQIMTYIWNYYLPFLYSCVSFLGVLLLLLCTPLGFARLFTVVGELIVKPKARLLAIAAATFLRDVQEEYDMALMEEEDLKRKLWLGTHGKFFSIQNGQNGLTHIKEQLTQVEKERRELEQQKRVSMLRRNIGYPCVMLLMLCLTGISVLMVAHNTLQLLIGIKALPAYSQQFTLGIASLSSVGPIGAAVEIVLILYLWIVSVVGLYTLPLFGRLNPHLHETPMIHVIGNCAVLLVLSSALPVLTRTLGITNFDLLGDFGRIEWLGNFYIVLFYNIVFAVTTALCLFTTFTAAMRTELLHRLRLLTRWMWPHREYKTYAVNGGSSCHKEE